MNAIGRNIRNFRKKARMTQEELAEKLNKGPKIVSGKVTKVKLGEEVYIPKFTQHGSVLSLPDKKPLEYNKENLQNPWFAAWRG